LMEAWSRHTIATAGTGIVSAASGKGIIGPVIDLKPVVLRGRLG